MSNSLLSQVANLLKIQITLMQRQCFGINYQNQKVLTILKTLGSLYYFKTNIQDLQKRTEAYQINSADFDVVNTYFYLKSEEFQKAYDLALAANKIDESKNQPYIHY